jgi:Icc-related predicted phosphoesterase
MRILAVSDLHYRLRSLDWVCEVASDYDAIVLAGDLLDIANPVPPSAQIVVIDSYLARLAAVTNTLVVSGNHDLDGPGEHGEQVSSWLRRSRTGTIYVDRQSVDFGDTRFTLCPWWDGPVTRDLIDEQLRSAEIDRPDRWIWVYHSPPSGTPLCSDGKRVFADEELANWIGQFHPDLVICGHIHQAPWVEGGSWYGRLGDTWVFNAGHLRATVPSHIVIDTSAETAAWYDAGNGGWVDLDLSTNRAVTLD